MRKAGLFFSFVLLVCAFVAPASTAAESDAKGFDKTRALSIDLLPVALRSAASIATSLTSAGCQDFIGRGSLTAEEALTFYFAFYSALDEKVAGEFMNSYADKFDVFVNKTLGLDESRDFSSIPSEDDGEMFYYAENGSMVCAYLPSSPTMEYVVTGYGGDETGRGEYFVEVTSYYDIEESGDVCEVITWRFEGMGLGIKLLSVGVEP